MLICIILLSSVMAMFLQFLALKLGVAMEKDLAQACREHYRPSVVYLLWILAEIGITACDLAEVIGSGEGVGGGGSHWWVDRDTMWGATQSDECAPSLTSGTTSWYPYLYLSCRSVLFLTAAACLPGTAL